MNATDVWNTLSAIKFVFSQTKFLIFCLTTYHFYILRFPSSLKKCISLNSSTAFLVCFADTHFCILGFRFSFI